MFTQRHMLTEKNRNVEICANLFKKKNWNITLSSSLLRITEIRIMIIFIGTYM